VDPGVSFLTAYNTKHPGESKAEMNPAMMNRNMNQQYQYRVYCATADQWHYVWSSTPPTTCPSDPHHQIEVSSNMITSALYGGNSHIYGYNRPNSSLFYGARINSDGQLHVRQPLSAFGYVKTQEDRPMIQVDFIYGVDYHEMYGFSNGLGHVSESNSVVHVCSGAASNSYSRLKSKRLLKYAPGVGANVLFTGLFSPGVEGNTQLLGIGSKGAGLFFGYHGSNFGIMRRFDSNSDYWTYQRDWNVDRMDGTGPTGQLLDHAMGNVYRICFQWLGFGMLSFFVEDSDTGQFSPVHRIMYSNKHEVPSIVNPSFPVYISSENTTNTSDVAVHCSSMGAMSEGAHNNLGRTMCQDNTKSVGDMDNIVNIITIRNKEMTNDRLNFIPIFLSLLSCSTDGTANVVISVFRDANVDGTHSWTDVNTVSSVIDYDTTGTLVTGGIKILSFAMTKADSRIIDMFTSMIDISPGQSITFGAKLNRRGATDVTVSITWTEDR
jgi:hypothetical protein